MGKYGSIKHQVIQRVDSMFKPGESRHLRKIVQRWRDIQETGAIRQGHRVDGFVASYKSRSNYIEQATRVLKAVKDKHGIRTIDEVTPEMLQTYIDDLVAKGKAPKTATTYINSTCFVLGLRSNIFKLPRVSAYEAHKSRSKSYDVIVEQITNPEQLLVAEFVRATGLRPCSLRRLTKDNFYYNGKHYELHGVVGKGGNIYNVTHIDTVHNDTIDRLLASSAGTKVFKVKHFNKEYNQVARRAFAQALYNKIASDTAQRTYKNKFGTVYDRDALNVVSKNLGHNREDVVVQSYLN